jgi:uncharacterized protein with ATP-grasp and redox domains
MKIHPECIPCQIKALVNSAIYSTDNTKLLNKIINQLLINASKFKNYNEILKLYNYLQKIVKQNTLVEDPFKDYKEKCNIICLNLEDEIKNKITEKGDSFETILRVCIAANTLDVSHSAMEINTESIKKQIDYTVNQYLDHKKIDDFKNEVKKSKRILFIGDNSGEIVFDKAFIEVLNREFNKKGKIIYAVRGGPTLNDATIEDANIVGIDKVCKVITSGIDLPGTLLSLSSTEFQEAFNNSELIISKGQGNFEGIAGKRKNIFFFLKIKCPVIANSLKGKYSMNTIAIVKNIIKKNI